VGNEWEAAVPLAHASLSSEKACYTLNPSTVKNFLEPFMRPLLSIATLLLLFASEYVSAGDAPSFEDVLSLRIADSPVVSPDGKEVVFEVLSTDWKRNEYDTELWLARDGEPVLQLTRTFEGSSKSARWSPDGTWISFLAKRGEKTQVHLIRAAGGEAQVVTEHKQGIGDYRWAPDGQRIAFISKDEDKSAEPRKERYGGFAVEDNEFTSSHIWIVDVNPDPWPAAWELPCYDDDKNEKAKGDDADSGPATDVEDSEGESVKKGEDKSNCLSLPKPQRLTEGDTFTVETFEFSPDGSEIVYEHHATPDIMSYVTADISILNIVSKASRVLIEAPGFDGSPQYSPDGQWVLYRTFSGNTQSDFYVNDQLKKVAADGGESIRLAADFDELISNIRWTREGVFFTAWNRTNRNIYKLDPDRDSIKTVNAPVKNVWSCDFSDDGKVLALSGRNGDTLTEVFKRPQRSRKFEQLTSMSSQVQAWNHGTSEVISWKSEDGAEIEGVLHKPANYDPTKRYPLLVVIHGGPTGISIPSVAYTYVYPIWHWVDQGAVVLLPNYRGSAGYGEAFRSLNVRNLGMGDAWDVMSGVEYLVEEGIADPDRMGSMGWSQGGYISAYLTTNTDRFKAISVGAGISNWMTYYVNTDIHPFTRQYLKATPWSDPEIYAVTSPMTNINNASTPTLIQHGEFDKRVPTPNAYELYQGLQDVGVETKLVIYNGFGHGITKPKERLAAVWHNWDWFAERVFGEEAEMPGLESGEDDKTEID
jgi:dipeptidyl aminopeptidase/acylaminoacyl peptidase